MADGFAWGCVHWRSGSLGHYEGSSGSSSVGGCVAWFLEAYQAPSVDAAAIAASTQSTTNGSKVHPPLTLGKPSFALSAAHAPPACPWMKGPAHVGDNVEQVHFFHARCKKKRN